MPIDLSKRRNAVKSRTFLAIPLPHEVSDALAALQGTVGAGDALKWVRQDLLHITVRFLGGLTPDELRTVTDTALMASSLVPPFSLRLSQLGAFPHERAPRVLWVGLTEDEGYGALLRLSAVLEAELESRGFEREVRPYTPHITLARTRDSATSADRRAIGEALASSRHVSLPLDSFPVEELVVMRSDLRPTGPEYTQVLPAPLGEKEGAR